MTLWIGVILITIAAVFVSVFLDLYLPGWSSAPPDSDTLSCSEAQERLYAASEQRNNLSSKINPCAIAELVLMLLAIALSAASIGTMIAAIWNPELLVVAALLARIIHQRADFGAADVA